MQAASRPELAEDIRTEANYFEANQERMRYPKFRKQGLFVGSGVIEAGCNAEFIVTQSYGSRATTYPDSQRVIR